MPEVLPMSVPKHFKVALSVLLNAVDLLVSFFLIFGGGFIANQRSAITGYVSVGFGLVLIYLSTGMWSKGKWKLVTRLGLYVVTLCVVLVTLIVFVTVRHEPPSEQTPLPSILIFFAAIVIFSAIHLRVANRSEASSTRCATP
jgi:hypothetical protein